MNRSDTLDVAFRGRLGRFALDAAFSVPARGVTALFGPSGCGKTTVLRCIAGLTHVADGTCTIAGESWQRGQSFLPAHRRPIGYVFQEASLFQHLSVERNLLYATRGHRPASGAGRIGFDEAVDLLGLAALLDRSPQHLSGGERQRVAIGRALLSQPKLLLMDEPLSALDRPTREEILPFLERLHDSLAIPAVYVTHDMGEVERLADTLVLMAEGRVQAAGPLARLQSDPTLSLAASRDAAVSLDGEVVEVDRAYGLVTVAVGGARLVVPGLAGEPGSRRRLRIAAGDVSLSLEKPRGSTILNALPVRIVSAAPVGEHEMLAVLQSSAKAEGPRLLARVTRRSWETLSLAEGMDVIAQVKGVALIAGPRGR